MINRFKENAQFITTTFHPELLTYADKYYGITYKNKVSRIDVIDHDQALEFVTQNLIQHNNQETANDNALR